MLVFGLPVLTLVLASWLSWQDLAKFLLHLGNLIILRSYLITMDKLLRLQKNTIPSVQAAETQSKGSFHPTTTISTRFHNQNA